MLFRDLADVHCQARERLAQGPQRCTHGVPCHHHRQPLDRTQDAPRLCKTQSWCSFCFFTPCFQVVPSFPWHLTRPRICMPAILWPPISTVTRWFHRPEWRYQHCWPVCYSARQSTWNPHHQHYKGQVQYKFPSQSWVPPTRIKDSVGVLPFYMIPVPILSYDSLSCLPIFLSH